MKKLLKLIAAVTLSASTAATVVACSPKEDITDDTLNDNAFYRESFIADIKTIVRTYVNSHSDNLFIGKSKSNNLDWLSYQNLSSKFTNVGESSYSISGTDDAISTKNDIDSLLNLSIALADEIKNTISETTEYGFLTMGVDRIFDGFTINPDIKVKVQQPGGSGDYTYTITFGMNVSFNYLWNNAVETEEISNIELNYMILSDEQLIGDITSAMRELPQALYTGNNSSLYKFDETDASLNSINDAVVSGTGIAAKIKRDFSNDKNSLYSNVKDDVRSYLAKKVSEFDDIEFNNTTTAVDKMMYDTTIESKVLVDGYVETTLFGKEIDGEVPTVEKRQELFERDFGEVLNKETFALDAAETIEKRYRVKLDVENNNFEGFISYGEISLNNIIVIVSGTEISLNPVALLYTYNLKGVGRSYAQRITTAFDNWRKLWGVTISNDRWSLFKLSQTSEAGKVFWQQDPKTPLGFLRTDSLRTKYLSTKINNGTGLSMMRLEFTYGTRNPKPEFDTKGYSVNFESYANAYTEQNMKAIQDGWKFNVSIGNLKFVISLADEQNYFNNIWLGSSSINKSKKYIIERGE